MINLDANTKSLQIFIDSSGTGTDVWFTASWLNNGPSSILGVTDDRTNGSTPVTVVAAPSSGQRLVKSLILNNAGKIPHIVTIQLNDSTGPTNYIISTITMAPGTSVDVFGYLQAQALGTSKDMLSSNIQAFQVVTGSVTLNSSHVNKWLHFADASNQSITLPAANSVSAGTKVALLNDTTPNATTPKWHTFTRAGSDTIVAHGTAKTAITLLSGNFAVLESDGDSIWYVKVYYVDVDWFWASAITITGSGSNPSKGSTTVDNVCWRRIGDSLHVRYNYYQTTVGTAGTSPYKFLIPGGFTIDTTLFEVSTNSAQGEGQGGFIYTAVQANPLFTITPIDSTHLQVTNMPSLASAAALSFSFEAIVPIVNW